jgi:polyisoprenoid-binding protein YceI
LRQADLLASDAWPTAYFIATQFGFEGELLRSVRGEFTLRGISQPLSLKTLHFACRPPAAAIEGGDAGALHEVCGGDFEGDFKRSDHGADFGVPFVADRVHLRVQVTGLR